MIREKTADDYYREHEVCPTCKTREFRQTLLSFIFHEFESYEDSNEVTCECGFRGVVDDLIPDPAQGSYERIPL